MSGNKPKLVVLTGAGISAESGIPTFRDSNGLWENHRVEEVASPEGWYKNPDLVLTFYNERRKKIQEVEPNAAHYFLKELEKDFQVEIVTQNIDDLHERAGSSNVLHLHGEILKVRSENNENLIYDWKDDLVEGDLAEDNAQLRPHIVWFGEAVPEMSNAIDKVRNADLLFIIGTSMQVYPAASLYQYVDYNVPILIINPVQNTIQNTKSLLHYINSNAVDSIPEIKKWLRFQT